MMDLDLKAAKAYFSNDPMLYEMKKQQFDLGIGGLGRADMYLFRYLSIPYIRISLEDVEPHIMIKWLDMPVLDNYPQVITWETGDEFHPKFWGKAKTYVRHWGQYFVDLWSRHRHVDALKKVLGPSKSQKAIVPFDQDHGLILGLGVSGVF